MYHALPSTHHDRIHKDATDDTEVLAGFAASFTSSFTSVSREGQPPLRCFPLRVRLPYGVSTPGVHLPYGMSPQGVSPVTGGLQHGTAKTNKYGLMLHIHSTYPSSIFNRALAGSLSVDVCSECSLELFIVSLPSAANYLELG